MSCPEQLPSLSFTAVWLHAGGFFICGALFEIVRAGTRSGGQSVSEGKDLRMLIVDDDREFRRSLTKVFEKAGFLVKAAATGYQAALLLKREQYPIIVLDLKMPGKSGMDLLREIKAKSPGSKVIVVTASADAANTRDAISAGAFEFLRKPLKRQEIFESARRALESAASS
jgi:DNA-binding NtrC family response regulator